MVRTAARSWPLSLLLGCTPAVSVPPSVDPRVNEQASDEAPQPLEVEQGAAPVAEPSPDDPEAEPEAEPEQAEPEQAESEPASGGEVIHARKPVAPPGTVPTITTNQPMVGTTDADVIRRVVRLHVQDIRDCYNLGLARDPALAGRLEIEFTIGPSGQVESAKASGFADPEVSKCIADAIATWTFPKPRGGGQIIVRYPFNLVSG